MLSHSVFHPCRSSFLFPDTLLSQCAFKRRQVYYIPTHTHTHIHTHTHTDTHSHTHTDTCPSLPIKLYLSVSSLNASYPLNLSKSLPHITHTHPPATLFHLTHTHISLVLFSDLPARSNSAVRCSDLSVCVLLRAGPPVWYAVAVLSPWIEQIIDCVENVPEHNLMFVLCFTELHLRSLPKSCKSCL